MTAYWISTYLDVTDPAKLQAYAALAGPAILDNGGTFLARSEAALAYEAGKLERSVVIAFDSVEAAQTCHDSPAYQEALAALGDGALRDLRIVPGVA
jgi:uncharacterized protein (DUF1330 family)